MVIEQTGISYTAYENFEYYNISGSINEYRNGSFSASFQLREGNDLVLEMYYLPGNGEDRQTINFFFEDNNKMQQYQAILYKFAIDALNKLPKSE